MFEPPPCSSAEQDLQQAAARLEAKRRVLCKGLLSLRDFAARQEREPLSCVCEGLYIGSLGAACDLVALKAAGVTHVLNLSPLVPCFFPKAFRYLRISVYDDPSEDLAQHFDAINRFIQKGRKRGAVLVHCFAGQSRSAAAVLAYLCGTQKRPLREALQHVTAAHPSARPNPGFLAQLGRYADRVQAGTLGT